MSKNISTLLRDKKAEVLEHWMNSQLSDASLREDLMSNEELRAQSKELAESLLITINETNITDAESIDFDPIREILSGISISRAQQGFSPRETGIYVFSLKEAIIQSLSKSLATEPETLLSYVLKLNKLMDAFGVTTFETFIKGREDVILRQTDEIAEISTPVIQIWNGILALPIIGTLDSARTQIVMESLLEQIVKTESTIAILDISGVPAVDSLVAQHLLKTVAATRLMGAECIISGIRPEIAQTVVHLGIDLSTIVTKATLANALKHAFVLLQLEVKRSQKEKLNS